MHRYPYELISTQNRIKFSSFVKLPERQPEIRNPVRARGAKKQGLLRVSPPIQRAEAADQNQGREPDDRDEA